MKILLLFFLFIQSTSCGFVARKGYGAKKPKTENKETITSWLTKYGYSTETVLTSLPQNYYDFIPGLPQAPFLFDVRTGNLLAIGFSNGKYCPKDTDKSFSSILPYQLLREKPDSFLISETLVGLPGMSINDKNKFQRQIDTLKLNLYELTNKTASLSGEPIIKLSSSDYDYTLIIPFALFLGKRLQLKDLKQYYFSALANRFARIRVVFLNLDKQEWWGEEWNKKINISY